MRGSDPRRACPVEAAVTNPAPTSLRLDDRTAEGMEMFMVESIVQGNKAGQPRYHSRAAVIGEGQVVVNGLGER